MVKSGWKWGCHTGLGLEGLQFCGVAAHLANRLMHFLCKCLIWPEMHWWSWPHNGLMDWAQIWWREVIWWCAQVCKISKPLDVPSYHLLHKVPCWPEIWSWWWPHMGGWIWLKFGVGELLGWGHMLENFRANGCSWIALASQCSLLHTNFGNLVWEFGKANEAEIWHRLVIWSW